MSAVIVVRIRHLLGKPPTIDVVGASGGHNIYVGPLVNDPEIEHGALINLLGVDQLGSIPEQGWRFVDPDLPGHASRNALHIIWLTHDNAGPLSNGDLQVGYNSVLPGHHYANPAHSNDKDLGPATNEWITVYADDILRLEFSSEGG